MFTRMGQLMANPPNGVGKGAATLAGSYTSVLAIDFTDGSMLIRDAGTPANNFSGTYNSKMTVVGSLPSGATGPLFNSTNYATLATSVFPFSATVGTIWVQATSEAAPSGVQSIWSITDGTSSNRIFARINATVPNYTVTATATQSTLDGASSPTAGTPFTMACTWAANDFRLSYNGGAVVSDVLGSIPTINSLALGIAGYSTAAPMNGRIRKLLYVPQSIASGTLVTNPPW